MKKKTPPKFDTFPPSAKKGILFLLLAWITHFFFLYRFWLFGIKMEASLVDQKLVLQMVVIALLVCFFVIRVRNWARVMGIVANILAILIHLAMFAVFVSADAVLAAVSGLCIVFFGRMHLLFFPKGNRQFLQIAHAASQRKRQRERKMTAAHRSEVNLQSLGPESTAYAVQA